jgi:hypothetical protein
MIFETLDKWKFVYEFKEKPSIDRELINKILWQAWKTTPSKNSFMPYKVHVIGPDKPDYKEIVYNTAAEKELLSNARNENENKWPVNPCKTSILSAEYVLVYTLRVEHNPSQWQIHLHEGGCYMDAWAKYEDRLEDYRPTIDVEIGLFARAVNALCLENGIDTNYISSFNAKSDEWKKLSFIDKKPVLIMPIGIAKHYRRDLMNEKHKEWDVKPDFESVVNFHG